MRRHGAGTVGLLPRDRGFERSLPLRDAGGFTVEFAEGVRGLDRTD